MLDAAQQRVGVAQASAGGALHQAAGDELVDRLQRRAGADLGKLAAANDQQQLDDELDLADAAARQLDVVGALGPPGGAPLRLVAHLDVELAQPLEDAVVEVATVDEGGDQRPERHRAAAGDARARGDDAALQPGEALPLAAVRLQVVLEHRQAGHRRPGVAVRSQRQVDAEDEAVLGDVADQRVEAARDVREVLVRADGGRAPVGLAVAFVDVDEVDVGRDVELARAELAHADDPEVDALAVLVARHAEALVLVGERALQGDLQRRLGELGHRQRDVGERRAFLDVEHAEALERQLARDAQRGDERRAFGLQPFDDGDDRRAVRQPGRQEAELVGHSDDARAARSGCTSRAACHESLPRGQPSRGPGRWSGKPSFRPGSVLD